MRRVLLATVLVFSVLRVQCQDTIVLNTGEKIPVQILDENQSEISYKKWSYLSGPKWIKQKRDIAEIRRGPRSIVHSGQTLDLSEKGIKERRTKCKSGNEIVLHVDTLYHSNRTLDIVEYNMMSYMASLPPSINKQNLQRYYLDRFDSSKVSGIADYILQDGETYLFVGGEERILEVVEDVVMLYSSMNSDVSAKWWIHFLEKYSKENDDIFADDIKRLYTMSNEILHPYRWDEGIVGRWIMLNKASDKGFEPSSGYGAPTIIDINNVIIPTGAHLLEPSKKTSLQNGNTSSLDRLYDGQINTSQDIYFNAPSEYAILQFVSEIIRDRSWTTDLVHSTLDANRKNEVEMRATIYSSDASLGDKIAADAMVSLATAAMNGLVSRLNVSSKNKKMYNILLFPNNQDVMNALVSYVSVHVRAPSSVGAEPKVYYDDYVKDKKSYMVRWEEEDSVFFISGNGLPITLSPVGLNDPLLDEYSQIKNRYSFKNPAYFFPLLVGNITGLTLIFTAPEIPELHKIAHIAGGTGIFVLSIMLSYIDMRDKKERAFYELNLRNIGKIRRKLSSSLSMSPTCYPAEKAMGVSVQLSF